jgi:hypothetical protein
MSSYENQNSLANKLNKVREIVMAVLFLAMGTAMLFAEYFKLVELYDIPKMLRYFFGAICFIYGAFRIWRAIKSES